MLKDKDDEFLGDSITHNIQHADNVWQAHGTVDRGSVYTKEPLLDLLFEGFNYSRFVGDYENYVARASTTPISGVENKAYVAARLQHDLYVLDTQYYSTSGVSSSHNIFSLSAYLKKAVALANPVYGNNSATKIVNLFGVTRVADTGDTEKDFKFENESLKTVKVKDILKVFLPDWHLDHSRDASAKLDKFINRYSKDELQNVADVEGADTKRVSLSKKPGTANLSLGQTFFDFLDTLNNTDYTFCDNAMNVVKTGKVVDLFLEDFSIVFHNPRSIKLPFYSRGKTAVDEVFYKDIEDTRTFKTRFIANSLSKNLYYTETGLSKPLYMDTLNDIVEESIFTNYAFYPSRPAVESSLANSMKLKDDLMNASGKYKHLYNKTDISYTTLLSDYVKSIDSIDTAISLFCPEVFSEYSKDNSPEQSWGIHFINEEATENLFQDTDNTYKLFNDVLIGYCLADTLIANRLGIGGIYYLISQTDSATSKQATSVTNPIPLDTKLNERVTNRSFYNCSPGATVTRLTYYPTISAVNAIYKLGHTPGKTAIDLPEAEAANNYSYDFADEIKAWLENECFIFKGNVYGDYVEELNFMQDLNPDSDVRFKSVRVKKTEIPYNRYQDSKYEVPYIEQTAPLVNNTIENEEGMGAYSSDALGATGNLIGKEKGTDGKQTNNVVPPFLYDYDKGSQKEMMDKNIDPRLLNVNGNAQRVNSKEGEGSITIEQRIQSPTIDELWTFLKYLTESDGSGINKGINERLPSFYGVRKDFIDDTIAITPANAGILRNTVNPRAYEPEEVIVNGEAKQVTPDANEKTIDILNWAPVATQEPELHWSPKENDKSKRVELQFGGYQITRFIEKIYDYEIKPFSRRTEKLVDDAKYEYNSEVAGDKNNVTGYLEKLYNSAILAFDLPEVSQEDRYKASVSTGLLFANVLDRSYKAILDDPTTDAVESDLAIFTAAADANLITKNVPVHSTVQRKLAFDAIANILNYHKADGENDAASMHNHYKKYLDNPKNLKEIERDLETLRQNLQTLAEFSVASFASLGYSDRAQNRGTLHQLHKNAYEYLSTFIYSTNNTIADLVADRKNTEVSILDLETDLNNTDEDLTVVASDKRVVFDDGNYTERYLREKYDASVLDLSSDPEKHSRGRHDAYRPNETLLSEVYLAADGTWRSVHEHTVLPVIFSKH